MEPTLEPPSQLNQILDRHMSFWLTQPNLVPFFNENSGFQPNKKRVSTKLTLSFFFLKDTEKRTKTTRPRGGFFFFCEDLGSPTRVSGEVFFFVKLSAPWMFLLDVRSNGDRINGLFFIYFLNGVYWGK